MNSKKLVIEESGTQLIPWDHICCGLSVQTIGSRFAPKSYLKLCESIGFHNKLNDGFNQKSLKITEISDKQILSDKTCLKSNENFDINNFDLVLNIDDKQLPKYITRLNDKDFRNKFIESKLLSYENSDKIIEEVLDQMKSVYSFAIKESIKDYVLRIGPKFTEKIVFETRISDHFNSVKRFNALFNFRFNQTLRQIEEIWDKKYRNLNIFDFDLSKTLNMNEFKTNISQNCQQMYFKLKYEWISDCNQVLLNDCSKLINYDCIQNNNFFDSIAALMSQLFRELILKNLENWRKILSDNSQRLVSMFKIDIKCKPRGNPYFVPSIDKLREIISFPLNYLLESNKNIDRIENNLILMKTKRLPSKYLFNVEVTDVDIQNMNHQILSVVNTIDFYQIIQNYEKGFTEKISEIMKRFENYRQNFSQYLANIFEMSRNLILDLIISPNKLNFGIFEINFHEFKTYVKQWIEDKINSIVTNHILEVMSLAKQVNKKLLAIEHGLTNSSDNCYELLKNLKRMQTIKSTFNSLMVDIKFIEDNWNSMVEIGTKFSIISETDFEEFHRIYYLPKKIQNYFDERLKRLGEEKTEIQTKLQSRVKSLQNQINNLENTLNSFHKKKIWSTFENTSDNCNQLKDINSLLDQLLDESQELNSQQKVLQLTTTDFSILNQMIDQTKGLSHIWGTALSFEKTQNKCMTKSLRSLDLKDVKHRINDLLSYCTQMNTTFKSNDLLQNVNTLQTNIETFKTNYIPLIEVFSSPVLRERHWLKINEIIGQRILWSRNPTLSEVISINNPNKYIKQISSLGIIARKEYELELLLDKMKNEWVDEWPTDALEIVANKFLEEEESLEYSVREKCAKAFKLIHLDSIDFFKRLNRQSKGDLPFILFVTPPMFIDMIQTFRYLLKNKLKELNSEGKRYSEGMETLYSVVNTLKSMQNQMINDFQPILMSSFIETENLMIKIERQTLKVEVQKEVIAADEAMANQTAACAQKIKDECCKELSQAVPAIRSAIEALNTLKTEDITVLRSMKCPPPAVRFVLEAVCILNDYKPERRFDPKNDQMIDDYWSSALRMMSDIKFLDKLKNYDRNGIQRNSINLIRQKYLHCEYFEPTTLERVSKACSGLANWVRAIDIYDRLINVIKPKREGLKTSQTELEEILQTLNQKQSHLRSTSDLLQQLNDQFSVMSKKKRQLEDNREKCRSKLVGVKHKITELKAKKIEFERIRDQLKEQKQGIVAELVLSSALITYTCALTSDKRNGLINKWKNYLGNECNFSFNKEFNFVDTIGESTEILRWAQAGMPTHQFDIENAIISHKSRRIPVIISKNNVINEWLIRLYRNLIRIDIEVENNFKDLLIAAIERGEHILIENIRDLSSNRMIEQLIESNVILNESQTQFIKFEEEIVGVSHTFRAFICSDTISALSPKRMSKISLIDWNTDSKSWSDVKSDVNTFQNKYISDLKTRIERREQFIEEENRFLEFLSNEKTNLLNENILSNNLSQEMSETSKPIEDLVIKSD